MYKNGKKLKIGDCIELHQELNEMFNYFGGNRWGVYRKLFICCKVGRLYYHFETFEFGYGFDTYHTKKKVPINYIDQYIDSPLSIVKLLDSKNRDNTLNDGLNNLPKDLLKKSIDKIMELSSLTENIEFDIPDLSKFLLLL